MIKKIILLLVIISLNIGMFVSADGGPNVNCVGLPGCKIEDNNGNISGESGTGDLSINWIGNIIGESIQYVAVLAVLSLMISGFLYLFSGGDEEKTKKAKTWIIWSLVGVLLSISAWGIINVINEVKLF